MTTPVTTSAELIFGSEWIVVSPTTGDGELMRMSQDPTVCLERSAADSLLGEAVAFCLRSSRLIEDQKVRGPLAKATARIARKVVDARSEKDLARKAARLSVRIVGAELSIFRWGVESDGYFGGKVADPIMLDDAILERPAELGQVLHRLAT